MVRIISGFARGLNLKSPSGKDVRPTTDRVKESLFSMLGDLRGAAVLELFAGTGSLGLEALSRGAERVVLVERNSAAVWVIRENLAWVQKAMPEPPDCKICPVDVYQMVQRYPEMSGTFDLVLADPPFVPDAKPVDAFVRNATLADWIGDALLVLQHPSDCTLPPSDQMPWSLYKQKRYGTSVLSFLEPDG